MPSLTEDDEDAQPVWPDYTNSPIYADLTPIPQNDGGPNALATIAYAPEYRTTSSYLRALMAKDERSDRALALTQHMIQLNPAHYTVWLYRARMLEELDKSIEDELVWLNGVSLKHIKNYQIWHHRQVLLTRLSEQIANGRVEGGARKLEDVMREELAFLAEMLDRDVKNYHVWSYRQWLVLRFDLFEGYGEIDEVERFVRLDIRNNSAWNHRWFLVFGRERDEAGHPTSFTVSDDTLDAEEDYAKAAIRLAPQNESPWSYLKGLTRKRGRPVGRTLAEFAREFADVTPGCAPEGIGRDVELPAAKVRSTFALDMLAEAYAAEDATKKEAEFAIRLLAERYDTMRRKYWEYRRMMLGLASPGKDEGKGKENAASAAATAAVG
ncbi:MAG: hypothetical protein Q9159_000819 [Coniocarpon cinnabarinum]